MGWYDAGRRAVGVRPVIGLLAIRWQATIHFALFIRLFRISTEKIFMHTPPVVLFAKDYEAFAVGDRLRLVLGLLDQLKDFDIGAIASAISKITSAPDAASAVRAVIDAFKLISTMTATTADDKIAAILDSLLTPDVLAILVKIFGAIAGEQQRTVMKIASSAVALNAADENTLSANAIPVGALWKIAMMLWPLFEKWLASRTAAPAA